MMRGVIVRLVLFICFSGFSQVITDTGVKVGIGVTNPEEKLQINGNLKFSSEYNKILWKEREIDGKIFSGGIVGDDNNYKRLTLFHNHSIAFQTGSNNPDYQKTRLYINEQGNVGLGTRYPSALLTVNGTLQILTNTKEQLIFSSVHRNEIDNRSLIAPQNLDNNGWDWGNEFGFHNYNRNWYFDNNLSIGSTNADGWKLAVNGKIRAKEIKVETNWSDFVFDKDYNLPTLVEVEKHINEKGHLKDIPSAKEVEENGIFLGEMDAKLLQKIEELTLYVIELKKENIKQENLIKQQFILLSELKQELSNIKE